MGHKIRFPCIRLNTNHEWIAGCQLRMRASESLASLASTVVSNILTTRPQPIWSYGIASTDTGQKRFSTGLCILLVLADIILARSHSLTTHSHSLTLTPSLSLSLSLSLTISHSPSLPLSHSLVLKPCSTALPIKHISLCCGKRLTLQKGSANEPKWCVCWMVWVVY